MNKTTMLDAAISYAHRGILVFPCKPRSNEPLIKDWQNKATTDENQVRAWWSKWPGANIGIPTGAGNRFITLDIDEGGEETLKKNGWTTPLTVMVKTADGFHAYFKHPGGYVKNRTGDSALDSGVEVKGDGGYVIAPPSIHPDTGESYEYMLSPEDAGIAICPEWLLKAIREGSGASSVDLSGPIEEGTRNNTLYAFGLTLKRDGLDNGSIHEALRFMNIKCCTPPLPDDEVETIAGSVAKSNAKRGELREYEEDNEVGVLMSEVKSEEVQWLWERRIPLGKLTLLEGDPDWGKSAITMDLAARVTTSRPMPHDTIDHVEPLDALEPLDHLGGVVILNAEDGLGDTIRPRLEAAGADLTKVLALPPMKDDNIVSIPDDISLIEKAIERVSAVVLIIDPLSAFMRGDPNKDSDVRKALTPLAKMAEHKDVAVLVVRHFNKNIDTRALYRGGGSIGIMGAAQSALAVAPHPNDDELRVLVPQKANLSKKAQSLAYTIVTAENGAARIEWKGIVNLTADELLTADKSEEARAKLWITDKLKDGPVLSSEIEAAADKAGISESTLKRAKKTLPVKSKKDGPNGEWRWHLVQRVQEGQEGQESQEYCDTESDCECEGRGCLECLTQELPFETPPEGEAKFCGHGRYEDCYVCNPNHPYRMQEQR
jgi:hypothetical protein